MSPHALHRTTSRPLERGVARTRTTSRSFAGVGIAAQCRAMSVRAFINSPTGPRTTHFWGPVANWGFVLAVRRRRDDATTRRDATRRRKRNETKRNETKRNDDGDGRRTTATATDDGRRTTPRRSRRAATLDD